MRTKTIEGKTWWCLNCDWVGVPIKKRETKGGRVSQLQCARCRSLNIVYESGKIIAKEIPRTTAEDMERIKRKGK